MAFSKIQKIFIKARSIVALVVVVENKWIYLNLPISKCRRYIRNP